MKQNNIESKIDLPIELSKKYDHLSHILTEMGSMVIGFSGGIDSTLLLRIATEILGEKVLAVIGKSETYPAREFEEAVSLAESFGSRYRFVLTEETDDLKFRENPPNRCYFCKTELFGKLQEIADEERFDWIADGTILDDLSDFRPGMIAKDEKLVRSPLLESGFTKEDVRTLARALNIPIWDKPSFACLASRFPYGFEITRENLTKVDAAENVLRDFGFRAFRVRHHDDHTARLELSNEEVQRMFSNGIREEIVERLQEIGYRTITLDLRGFRSGSMNDGLSKEAKERYQKGSRE